MIMVLVKPQVSNGELFGFAIAKVDVKSDGVAFIADSESMLEGAQ